MNRDGVYSIPYKIKMKEGRGGSGFRERLTSLSQRTKGIPCTPVFTANNIANNLVISCNIESCVLLLYDEKRYNKNNKGKRKNCDFFQ